MLSYLRMTILASAFSLDSGSKFMFVGNINSESATLMSVLSLDEKSRVLLDKNIREASGLKKGSKLVAIPFKGGVTLVDVTGKSFVGSRPGFAFDEEQHEASKLLFHKDTNNSKHRKGNES